MAGTVTVACKLPHGLKLRVFKMVERSEPVLGGGMRTFKQGVQDGPAVTINGCAMAFGQNRALSGGFALTPGVDADFFAKWLEQNADHDAVKNHLIFANARSDFADKEGKEKAEITSGLEPLKQKGDARSPKLKGMQVEKAA